MLAGFHGQDGAISWLLKLPLVGYDLGYVPWKDSSTCWILQLGKASCYTFLTGCGPGRAPYSRRTANMAPQLNGATGCAPGLNRVAL